MKLGRIKTCKYKKTNNSKVNLLHLSAIVACAVSAGNEEVTVAERDPTSLNNIAPMGSEITCYTVGSSVQDPITPDDLEEGERLMRELHRIAEALVAILDQRQAAQPRVALGVN